MNKKLYKTSGGFGPGIPIDLNNLAIYMAGQDPEFQNFMTRKKWILSKDNQLPFGTQDLESAKLQTNKKLETTPTFQPVTYSDTSPFLGVAGVAGLSFMANALERWGQGKKDLARQRKQGMTDFSAPVVSGSRGDYTVNEEYFRPDQYTPVQFGAMPLAKNGGYFDSPVDVPFLHLPDNLPALSTETQATSVPTPMEASASPEETDIEHFKSGINQIELSGNRKGYNVEHNKGSSAFGPYGFLANRKAALGSVYKKYFKDNMSFLELVSKMKQDGVFQEEVMNLHSKDLLKRYDGNPFAAALEHFAGPMAAGKFVQGTLDLNSTPGGNNVSYRKYLNRFGEGAGLNQRFREGGQYYVTQDELMEIMGAGGEIEFI